MNEEQGKTASLFIKTIIISFFTLYVFNALYKTYNNNWICPTIILGGLYLFTYIFFRTGKVILQKVTTVENIIEKNKNKEGPIYIRDIESSLSPASVSYLMNNKIELKKDIVAMILNLISKNVLLINDNFEVIKNDKESDLSKLSEDELYVYWWVIGEEKEFDKEYFLSVIKNSLKDYIYIKRLDVNWFKFSLAIFILIMGISAVLVLTKISPNLGLYLIIFNVVVVAFLVQIILSIIQPKKSQYFTYTKKGIQEVLNWDRYRKFMEDFGRLEDYELDSIIIWDKYLAYAVALNINREYKNIKIKNLDSKTILNINKNIEKEINKRLGDL